MVDARQLKRIMLCDASLARYPLDIVALDELLSLVPASRSFVVINTDPSTKEGRHWIMVSLKGAADVRGRNIYFDSLGKKPEDYNKTLPNFLGEVYETIDGPIQEQSSDLCGIYILFVMLCLARGYKLDRIFKVFTGKLRDNDILMKRFYKLYTSGGFDEAFGNISQ